MKVSWMDKAQGVDGINYKVIHNALISLDMLSIYMNS
jgi:hypothetical protein